MYISSNEQFITLNNSFNIFKLTKFVFIPNLADDSKMRKKNVPSMKYLILGTIVALCCIWCFQS